MDWQVFVADVAVLLNLVAAAGLGLIYLNRDPVRDSRVLFERTRAAWILLVVNLGVQFVLRNRAAGRPFAPEVSEAVILGVAVLLALIPTFWIADFGVPIVREWWRNR